MIPERRILSEKVRHLALQRVETLDFFVAFLLIARGNSGMDQVNLLSPNNFCTFDGHGVPIGGSALEAKSIFDAAETLVEEKLRRRRLEGPKR